MKDTRHNKCQVWLWPSMWQVYSDHHHRIADFWISTLSLLPIEAKHRQAQVGYGSESSRQGGGCTETSGKYK